MTVGIGGEERQVVVVGLDPAQDKTGPGGEPSPGGKIAVLARGDEPSVGSVLTARVSRNKAAVFFDVDPVSWVENNLTDEAAKFFGGFVKGFLGGGFDLLETLGDAGEGLAEGYLLVKPIAGAYFQGIMVGTDVELSEAPLFVGVKGKLRAIWVLATGNRWHGEDAVVEYRNQSWEAYRAKQEIASFLNEKREAFMGMFRASLEIFEKVKLGLEEADDLLAGILSEDVAAGQYLDDVQRSMVQAMAVMLAEIALEIKGLDLGSEEAGIVMGRASFEGITFALGGGAVKAAAAGSKQLAVAKMAARNPFAGNTKLASAWDKIAARLEQLKRKLAKIFPPSICFPAGTPVAVPGGWAPIESLEPGDAVLSWDEETGQVRPSVVTSTGDSLAASLTQVTYRFGVDGPGLPTQTAPEVISATAEHPFYLPEEGAFVPAEDLRPSDTLLRPCGRTAQVVSVATESFGGDLVTTYNLGVAQTHTYFVGHARVLVHNQRDRGPKYDKEAETKKGVCNALEDLYRQGLQPIRNPTRSPWYAFDYTLMEKPEGKKQRKVVVAAVKQKKGPPQNAKIKLKPEYLHGLIGYVNRKLVPRWPWPAKAISISASGDTTYGKWRLPNFDDLERVLTDRREVKIVDQTDTEPGVELAGKIDQNATIQVHHMVPRYVQRIALIWGPGKNPAKENLSPSIAWRASFHQRDFHHEALHKLIPKNGGTLANVYNQNNSNPEYTEPKARRQLLIHLEQAYEQIGESRRGAIAKAWLEQHMIKAGMEIDDVGFGQQQ